MVNSVPKPGTISGDALEALGLVSRSSWRRSLVAWLQVPFGVVAVMAVCFGVDRLISLGNVSFPASVACMIVLFLALMLCEFTLGSKRTKKIVALVEIPCGFALRYINIFFCPAFVTLPLSPSISAAQVGKIIAVFLLGYGTVFTCTAYLVRALRTVFGTSKRAIIERAEELGNEDDNIPMTDIHLDEGLVTPPDDSGTSTPALQAPLHTQDPSEVSGTGGPPVPVHTGERPEPIRHHHDSLALSRAQRWATSMTANLDMITYALILIFLGLPIYYAGGYSMPLQLSINVVCFLLAVRIPPKYKTFLHPVLVSSFFTVIAIWIFTLIDRSTLDVALSAYSTGTEYTELWDQTANLLLPGAGDIFASVLDVSIVALGLPMFQYRQELKTTFAIIIIPNVALAVCSLLAYPALCHVIGISSARSLAFPSRSLTLALATPATQNLGGDLYTAAPLCIVSGIMGVIVGPWALRKLRVPEDDYVTRGITLGANSSAVATALLLTTDPRAAAFSSLSMGLFGTVTVALTSIPPFADFVRGLAGA